MCEFCLKHGEGEKWYLQAKNYSEDLMSDLRPRTPTVWLFPSDRGLLGNRSIRRVYARSFSGAETLPDLVVRMSCVPTRELWNLEAPPDDPVVARLSGVSYRTLVERRCYEISRKVSEQAAARALPRWRPSGGRRRRP